MNNKHKRLWKAREFTRRDENSLPNLFISVSGYFDEKYWKWLYKNNPSGHGHIWLAERIDNKAIVGQYAIIPTTLIIQGKRILGSQSLGTMTHPAYQKQGIFKNLATKLLDDSVMKGVDLVYGFPNKNSSHGFLKYLDFFVLFKPKLFCRPLDFEALLKLKLKNKYLSILLGFVLKLVYKIIFYRNFITRETAIEIKQTKSFPPEIDNICSEYNKTFKNMVARSRRYLNWRYHDRPDQSYKIYLAYKNNELLGYCVYGHTEREGINIGLIMDLFVYPVNSSTLNILTCHVINEMEIGGEALASCLLQPKSPMLKSLKKCGLIFPLNRFPPFILRLTSDNLRLSDINNLEDWHISFGDADFV